MYTEDYRDGWYRVVLKNLRCTSERCAQYCTNSIEFKDGVWILPSPGVSIEQVIGRDWRLW